MAARMASSLPVVDDPVIMGVLSGEDRGPAGGAEGRGDVSGSEVDSAGRETVQVGSLEEGVIHEPHGVVAMVVDEDKYDDAGS